MYLSAKLYRYRNHKAPRIESLESFRPSQRISRSTREFGDHYSGLRSREQSCEEDHVKCRVVPTPSGTLGSGPSSRRRIAWNTASLGKRPAPASGLHAFGDVGNCHLQRHLGVSGERSLTRANDDGDGVVQRRDPAAAWATPAINPQHGRGVGRSVLLFAALSPPCATHMQC